MTPAEKLGKGAGYVLGALTFTISFCRKARMFHPSGIMALGEVAPLRPDLIKLHPYVMVRFTSAIWKKRIWPDVLGITLRFSQSGDFREVPKNDDQDLLFASFAHPWETPIGPFLTRFRNFFSNTYYAVSPFEYQKKKVIFRITSITREIGSRTEVVRKEIQAQAVLRLWMKEGLGPWIEVGNITLTRELDLDQEKLRFDPFLNGLGIKPRGFIQHLRIGAYRLSQRGRALRHSL